MNNNICINTQNSVVRCPALTRTLRVGLALLAVNLFTVPGISQADIVQPTACILDQPHAPVDKLNCTANDIELSNPVVTLIDQCDFPGDDIALADLSIDITNNAADRYDIGVWMSTDGDPNGDGSYTGICAAGSLPAPSPAPHTDDGDMCGDVSKIAADPDLSTSLGTVVLLCEDDDEDGFLDVPITVTWKQKSDNDCSDSTYAVPLNASKCSDDQVNLPIPIPGQIIVEKQTVPLGDATFFDFHITGPTGVAQLGTPFPGAVDFSLNGISPTNIWDSAQYAGGLTPGEYTLNEEPANGWETAVACNSSKGGNINPNTINLQAGEVIHCIYTNAKHSSTGAYLIKIWKNGISGDKVLLTLRGDAQNPVDGSDQVDGPRSAARATVSEGDIVDFEEVFDPDVSNKYSTLFKCTRTENRPVYTPGEKTARLTIGSDDLNHEILCLFLNSQVNTHITLSKVWVGGKPGDSVDLKIRGGSGSEPQMDGSSTAPNITVDATETALADDVIILAENFTIGKLANYSTELVCTGATNGLQYTSGRRSGKLTIDKNDVGKDIHCTFTNTRKKLDIVLNKTWAYGQIGDTAALTLEGTESLSSSTATSTVITGAKTEADTTNQATIKAFAGETVELNETLNPDGALYQSEWRCRGLLMPAPTQGTSGSFVVPVEPADTLDLPITCTFTNKRKTATLRLAKSWVNAFVSDKVDVRTTGLANNAILHSVANMPTETDYGTEVSVFVGETAILSDEIFDPLSAASNYTDQGWVCDGTDQNAGDGLTITAGDEGNLITCTIENIRNETTFTLNKAWVNARSGDVVELSADGSDMNGEIIAATSTAPLDSGASMTVYAGEAITFAEKFKEAAQVLDYTVTWECTDGITTTSGTTLTSNAWLVEADPAAIACTFTNTGIPGQIIVEKATIPSAFDEDFDFHITGPQGNPNLGNPFPGNVDFILNGLSPTIWDSAQFDGGLVPGQYTVSEDPVAGWNTEVVCSSSMGGVIDPTAIDLRLAEIIHCTYTNTKTSTGVNLIKLWKNGLPGDKVILTLGGDAQNPTDGSSQVDGDATAATSTAMVGSTVSFEETFTPDPGVSANYSTEFKCLNAENEPVYTPGERTASLLIDQNDVSRDIVCYFRNTQADTHITLSKTWDNGILGDSVDLIIGGGSGSKPAIDGTSTAPNSTTAATSTALVDDVVTLIEDFSVGQDANYATALSCSGATNDIQYIPGQLTGELTIHKDDLGKTINCIFTNTRKTATLRLAKSWVNAFVSDKVDAQTTGLFNDAMLHSEANIPTEIDYGKAVTVFVGETAMLSDEIFDPLAAAENYTDMGWVCDGVDQIPGDGITILPGDEGKEITCTIENTRKTVEVVLQKTWQLGRIGDTAALSLTGLDSLANSTATSTVLLGTPSEPDTSNQASIIAYAGETVMLDEILGPDSTLYQSALSCGGLLNPDPTQATSGSFVVPADQTGTPTPATPIVCTFTNSRKTSTLRLAKSWVNASVGDKIEAHTTGLSKNPFLKSEANTATEVDYGFEVSVLVGETAILSDETFDPLTAAENYTDMGWVCDGADQTPGDGITILPGDEGRTITCTIENTRKTVEVVLQKTWQFGRIDDTAVLSLTGLDSLANATATSTVLLGTPSEPDTTNQASIIAYAGETVTLDETLGPDSTLYNSELSCEGLLNPDPTSGSSGSFVVPFGLADTPAPTIPITCTFSNTRKSARMTINKQWINANISDAVIITGASASSGSTSGGAIANSHDEIDPSVVTFTIYAGDSVTISEDFSNGDALNYDISISPNCSNPTSKVDQAGDLHSASSVVVFSDAEFVYTVPDDPQDECWTISNEGKFATLTLLKVVELGEYYPAETDDFILTAVGNTDTLSGISGADEVTNQFIAAGSYNLSEADAAGKDWLASSRFQPNADGWVCDGNSQSVQNGPAQGEGTLDLISGESVSCTITNIEKPNIPVTLSFMHISNKSGHTVFEWETITETNNVGFALYYKNTNGDWAAVDNGAFVLSKGAGTTVKRYRYDAASIIDAVSFSLADLNNTGFQTVNGPFSLDEVFGSKTKIKATNWNAVKQKNRQIRAEQKKLNKEKVLEKQRKKLEQIRTPAEKSNRSRILNGADNNISANQVHARGWVTTLLQALVSPTYAATAPQEKPVQLLNLEINQRGIYQVSHDQLMAQGIDLRGYDISRIGLISPEGSVPLRIRGTVLGGSFGDKSVLEFIGEPLNSLYVSSNIYTLVIGATGSADQIQALDQEIPAGRSQYSYQAESRYAPDLQYNYSSPHASDPWFAASMKRVPGSQTPEFEASFKVDHVAQHLFTVSSSTVAQEPYKRAQIRMNVWGASDIPDGGPDHRLKIAWNSQDIGVADFDGVISKDIRETLADGNVVNGLNRIKLTMPDNGQIIDLVDINEVVLSYPRRFVSSDGNTLIFNSSGGKFTVAGFDRKVRSILRKNADNSVDEIVNFTQGYCGTAWGCTVTFAGSGSAADYYLSTGATLSPLSLEMPPAEADLFAGEAEYLIITNPLFVDEINEFSGFKSSLSAKYNSVDVVGTDTIYAQYNNHVTDPEAIRTYIKDAANRRGTKVVLLVGGDTYDYKNHLGFGATSYLPSLYGPVSIRETYLPLDSKYVDINDDGLPDLSMGRLPVKTVDELHLLLEKRALYIDRSYQNKALFVADSEQQGAYNFKNIADRDIRGNFSEWAVTKAYLDDQSSQKTNASILNAMDKGTSLVSYYGHAATSRWSSSAVLRAEDAALLNNANPSIVTQWGCWSSYYVEPQADTMAQRFLMENLGGAVTVGGAASQTSGAAEHDFANYFNTLTTGAGALPMGEAILQAKRSLASTRPGNKDIVLAWTLLGFPELRISDSGL